MKATLFLIALGLYYGAFRVYYGYDHILGWVLGVTIAVTIGAVVGININKMGSIKGV